jgi:putative ABC transport system substrate-binding protein
MECRQADEATDQRFRQLAEELVKSNVPLIFAVSSAAVRGVRAVSTTIPVVALDLESDPVRSGLAVSLARPGSNITGVFLDAEQMNGKRLQILKELFPRLTHLTVLWDASLEPEQLKATEAFLRAFGLRFEVTSIRGPGEFAEALHAARRRRSDAVMVMEGPFVNANAKQFAELAIQQRLPTIGNFPTFVEAGGLMSYGPNVDHLFRQVTTYIDRILKGAKPGDLPIERPTHFYTAVNLKTAKALNLTIPPSLLLRADLVVR